MYAKLAEGTGIQNTSATNKDQLRRYINTAGREIWNTRDLPGSTFEQYFSLPIQTDPANPTTQITLPWYCQGIRAARWTPPGLKLELNDLRPRYQATPWRQQLLVWRIVGSIPLATALDTAQQLTFFLPAAQTEQVNITITGATNNGASITETVSIPIGQTTVTTTNQWLVPTPVRISKNVLTTMDVIIRNNAGSEVGRIANRQYTAENLLVKIAEDSDYFGPRIAGTIEILYKKPYEELWYDTDVFVNTDYEDALVWRARANFEALQDGDLSLQRAAALAAKSDELIARLSANQESGIQMNVNFAPNRYANAGRYGRGRRGYFGGRGYSYA